MTTLESITSFFTNLFYFGALPLIAYLIIVLMISHPKMADGLPRTQKLWETKAPKNAWIDYGSTFLNVGAGIATLCIFSLLGWFLTISVLIDAVQYFRGRKAPIATRRQASGISPGVAVIPNTGAELARRARDGEPTSLPPPPTSSAPGPLRGTAEGPMTPHLPPAHSVQTGSTPAAPRPPSFKTEVDESGIPRLNLVDEGDGEVPLKRDPGGNT